MLITTLYESFRAAAASAAAAQPAASAAADFAHPTLPERPRLRPCEPCRVTRVDYVIAGGVLRHTCARVTLRAEGGEEGPAEFTIDVPPPLGDDDEFLVPRARFDEAAAAAYPLGTRVQVRSASNLHGKLMLQARRRAAVVAAVACTAHHATHDVSCTFFKQGAMQR